MKGKKQGLTEKKKGFSEKMKADLKQYLESQGIQNPRMEVTEEELEKTRRFLREIKKRYDKK